MASAGGCAGLAGQPGIEPLGAFIFKQLIKREMPNRRRRTSPTLLVQRVQQLEERVAELTRELDTMRGPCDCTECMINNNAAAAATQHINTTSSTERESNDRWCCFLTVVRCVYPNVSRCIRLIISFPADGCRCGRPVWIAIGRHCLSS